MDATLDSLAKFADPARWVVVPNVPVLDTFDYEIPARKAPDGSVLPGKKVKLDVPMLHALCQKANAREARTGDVCPLTLGHTVPGAPETAQPPVVGYAKNFRVGTFGPGGVPCAMADFWYDRQHWGQGYKADEYPRRSVELWFQSQMFDPIALLKSRTPMRDLGLLLAQKGIGYVPVSDQALLYPAANDFKLCCSMESPMDPTQHPDANAPDNDFLEKMMKCMAHPRMHEAMRGAIHAAMGQSPGAPAAGGPPPLPPHSAPPVAPPGHHTPPPMHAAYMGPTSGAMPGQHPMAHHTPPAHHQPPHMGHEHATHHQMPVSPEDMLRMQLEHYENLKAQMQRQQDDMAAIKREAKQARAERLSQGLWHQGYDIDCPDFVVRLMRVEENAWPNEIDWVRKHCRERERNPEPVYQSETPAHFSQFDHGAPVGGALVPGLDQRPDQRQASRPLSADEQEKCYQFIREHPEWEPHEAMDRAVHLVRPSANGVK